VYKVDFLSSGEITDSLRMGRNRPEVREKLTMLVIVGTRTDAHSLRSQVGIRSESDCLLGQNFRQNLEDFRFGSKCKRGEIRQCCRRRG